MQKKRIQWIDVAKFLGIFSIYLGHLDAGLSFNFVFSYHVPLFFLISGCMENLNVEKNFIKYFLIKVKKILIPFFVFSLIAIVIKIIETNASTTEVKNMLILLLKGNIRNTFFAGSLWFLSCLFVMEILFYIIKKVKFKPLILLICLGLFVISNILIVPKPIFSPHFIYNIDSALYYIIYYAIGFILFPYIQKLFKLNNIKYKIFFAVSGIFSFLYSACVFLGKDYLEIKQLDFITFNNIYVIFEPVIKALIIIWLMFIIAKILENNSILNKIGKETLYLCGSEYIIKTIIICFVGILGLNITLSNSLSCYIYTFLLLILVSRYLVPIEKKVIEKIQDLFFKMFRLT